MIVYFMFDIYSSFSCMQYPPSPKIIRSVLRLPLRLYACVCICYRFTFVYISHCGGALFKCRDWLEYVALYLIGALRKTLSFRYITHLSWNKIRMKTVNAD